MIVPEDILQNQLCSQCHKYLSVDPIRVFPNRQIKCGRCLEEDNVGVESPLYQTVVKDMMFPCVNRYDGCNVVLLMSKMTQHENDCIGGLYDCFLCFEFRGTVVYKDGHPIVANGQILLQAINGESYVYTPLNSHIENIFGITVTEISAEAEAETNTVVNEANCSGSKDVFCETYDLNLHCQKHHQKETLENSEFLIDFYEIYQNKIYFYAKGTRLFFILCNYDMDLKKLSLDVIFIGKRFKGNMSYSLRLYSVEKELLYKKTKTSLCSVMEMGLGTSTVVNMKSIKFSRNLVICQIFIHEEPELTSIKNIPVIDSAFNTFILKCTFKNIRERNFEESVFFPAVYYFQDIEWRVFIKRKLSLTDYKRKFGVFLQWEDPKEDKFETCKVSAKFSLVSSEFRRKLSKNFVKREYKGNYDAHGFMMTDWNYVMDPASGYVKDNCINIEVKVKIYLDCKKEVKCNDCYQSCVYCN